MQICFCQNFVKFRPILTIFGRKMTNRLQLCEMHSFSISPNSCHHNFAQFLRHGVEYIFSGQLGIYENESQKWYYRPIIIKWNRCCMMTHHWHNITTIVLPSAVWSSHFSEIVKPVVVAWLYHTVQKNSPILLNCTGFGKKAHCTVPYYNVSHFSF